ncbi:phosphorylase family protein [Antarcticirhabdus aurantiaca]|uniref:Uncharacterized protein n=1 Tax=Antarcticirhabdus aurantiaca TaxID=2606717 RepID=A0ACD4NM20_9HYPH|nr:hypothetical protein [Antarcticirhabdus aurantiaca]WAJ27849.1 hypothetical protein OXU80_23890 [Jeongeuplla avenae]
MVAILLVEDSAVKRERIREFIDQSFPRGATIDERTNFASARKAIFERRYDLIIVDILLPRRDDEGEPQDVSADLLEVLLDSAYNKSTSAVAVTQYKSLAENDQKAFAAAGIVVVHYEIDRDNWKIALNVIFQRLKVGYQFDFLVFCALEKEREAFRASQCRIGELEQIEGFDCLHISINDYNGLCIKLPRMGIVDSAAVAASAIARFSPEVVAVSGICAGFKDETSVGSLLIADTCWEHQSGKWKGDEFKMEHYQSNLGNRIRTMLSQFVEQGGSFLDEKRNLISEDNVINQPVKLVPFVTGSAVIASSEKIEEIKRQHRKLAGLDMEMYGVYRACEISSPAPEFFGAKTVVDLADEAKGDKYHVYGSVLSARFVVRALARVFD